jgi:serine protein kinase
MSNREQLLNLVQKRHDRESFKQQHWEGSFREYLDLILEDPRIVRNAHQRIYDMIMSFGTEEFTQQKEKLVRYHFFSDPLGEGDEAIFGLERALMRLVGCFKSAAAGFGTEKRVLLLHGPVGSSKSTIVRLMKRGLEQYSHTDDGRLYTFQWRVMENGEETWVDCPMHAEPLLLVPEDTRKKVIARLNESFGGEYRLSVEGDLCPASRWYYQRALELHDGDWQSMIENEVRVRRLLLSEKDRVGIGTFQPKDEKNQDSTELTGDINYRKIASTARTRTRGRSTSTASSTSRTAASSSSSRCSSSTWRSSTTCSARAQEHKIKPKKFAQTHIDEVIIGHTNEPEYKKLQNNELMEAFRDRTIKIDIPYNIRSTTRSGSTRRTSTPGQRPAHPHRAAHDRDGGDVGRADPARGAEEGRALAAPEAEALQRQVAPGLHEDNIKELREESPREGMDGISPALHPGQDLQHAGQRAEPRSASTRSWS